MGLLEEREERSRLRGDKKKGEETRENLQGLSVPAAHMHTTATIRVRAFPTPSAALPNIRTGNLDK